MALRQPVARELEPHELPIPKLAELPGGGLKISYDRFVDSLYVDFYGKSLPSVSTPLNRDEHAQIWIRTDFDTDRVTGVHVENFMTYALSVDPWLSDALLVAEYPDSTPEQSAAIRKRAAERITQPWSDERFLDELRRVVNG